MNKLIPLAVAFSLFAVMLLPGVSSAQSVGSLQAEINSLLAEVQQLEAQLAVAGGSTTATTWCYTFNTNLSIGVSGSAVTVLQTALQKDGESVAISGTFDDQTAAAVMEFQDKYASDILTPSGLTNGTGYVGSSTRSKLNALFGCGHSIPTPTSTIPVVVVAPPIACPMFIPYCPYGSYTAIGSNGCNEIMCDSAPTSTPPVTPLPIESSIASSSVPSSTPPVTTPIACPMTGQAPYCPYGNHSVLGSNGCSYLTCNPAPTSTPSISVSESPSTVMQGSTPGADGATVTILWNVENMPSGAGVSLSLVNTNGENYGLIDNSQAAGGSYSWQVPGPRCFASGGSCLRQTGSNSVYYTDPGSYYIQASVYTPYNSCFSGDCTHPTFTTLASSDSGAFTIGAATTTEQP